jgi:hypothetical protein
MQLNNMITRAVRRLFNDVVASTVIIGLRLLTSAEQEDIWKEQPEPV